MILIKQDTTDLLYPAIFLFINDLSYFSTFIVDTDELKIYRRPRVELYSFKNSTCTTTYFLKYEDAQLYGELKAKENNLIK